MRTRQAEERAKLLKLPTRDEEVARLVRALIVAVGEDPEREGVRRTPERVARMVDELLEGYSVDPVKMINDAVFTSDYEDIVLVRDIEFYSLCEHHLLPFFGRVHVAYIPDGRVLGLSKIPRTVEMYARRLQLQEQMTQQIAEFIRDALQPKGIAVVVEASHLCAMMRGVRKSDALMVTRTLLGAFKEDAATRAALYELLNQGRTPDRSIVDSWVHPHGDGRHRFSEPGRSGD